MILTDRVNTFTTTADEIEEEPIVNTNSVVTIGGVVKSQADSMRLSVMTTLKLTRAELASLTAITNNFASALYYTPGWPLYNRATAAEMEVIMTEPPKISQRGHEGSTIVYFVTLKLEEVISA